MKHFVVLPPTRRRAVFGVVAMTVTVVGSALITRAQSAPSQTTAAPGVTSDGSTLLPNGWRLAPAGQHLALGDLPLNVAISPDGRYALVTNNGLSRPTLSVIDIASWAVKSTLAIDVAWYGLAWSPDGTKVYVGGASQN